MSWATDQWNKLWGGNQEPMVSSLSNPVSQMGTAAQPVSQMGTNPQPVSNVYNPPVPQPQGSVLGDFSTGTGNQLGGSAPAPAAPAPAAQADVVAQQTAMAQAQKAQEELLKQQRIASDTETINQLYQDSLGQLGTREQQATNNLNTTTSQIGTEFGASQANLGSALQRALATLKLQRDEAAGIQAKGTQQATELANQSKVDQEMAKREGLSQTGNAIQTAVQGAQNFLAGKGLGDSSAAQAMGELIYRQGAGDIAKTMQTLQTNVDRINKTLGTNIIDINTDYDTNIKNIQNEEANATGFYQDSLGKLEAAKTNNIAEAKKIFDNAMLQINALRTQYGKSKEAEIMKAQTDAWNQFQNNSFQITQQLAQDKLALDKWAMERQASIDDAVQLAQRTASVKSSALKDAELQQYVDNTGTLRYGMYDPNTRTYGNSMTAEQYNQQTNPSGPTKWVRDDTGFYDPYNPTQQLDPFGQPIVDTGETGAVANTTGNDNPLWLNAFGPIGSAYSIIKGLNKK